MVTTAAIGAAGPDLAVDTPRQPEAQPARLFFDTAILRYDFGDGHALSPRRFAIAFDLCRQAGLLTSADEVAPPAATNDQLCRAHAADYVAALENLSRWAPLSDVIGMPWLEVEARRYGLDQHGDAVFAGAHAAAAAIAGASVAGLRAAAGADRGGGCHAFNPAGGLHHAHAARAAGFCLYNDAAVAIADLLARRPDSRVLYVDLDAHHGDGVEAILAGDPRVLTVSFHQFEAGFFPGTGAASLVDRVPSASSPARLQAVNVPFPSHAGDAVWQGALEMLVPPIAAAFRPTVLISQHGCDTHVWDPLADLNLTSCALAAQAKLLHHIAHEYCGGSWLALGGGGYEVRRVVPRSWAILWSEMTGRALPATVPEAWRSRWESATGAGEAGTTCVTLAAGGPRPLPIDWLDDPDIVPEVPTTEDRATREQVSRETEEVLELLRLYPPRA